MSDTTQQHPPSDPVARAAELFSQGISCSCAVLAAVAPRLGLPEDQAARVACCFGGGMIGSGKTCGAVTGAMMALGLAHGSGVTVDLPRKQAAYAKTAELWRRFAERHGSIACKEILGVDISTPEGRAKAAADGLFQTRCAPVVRSAAELLVSLL
ncbi:MAG TPA: C-GCAxxG-C-C family protein [Anaeromyxobacter sp.]|nr:C-GCAxxG-C-C family protein [Anaeromyxobacter sp.]